MFNAAQIQENKYLAAKTKTSAAGQLGLAVVTFFTMILLRFSWIDESIVTLLVIINALRLYWSNSPRMEQRPHARQWYIVSASMILLTAALWSTLCCQLLILQSLMDANSIFTLIIAGGVSSGATAALGHDLKLARSFILIMLIPIMLTFSFFMAESQLALTFVVGMYLAFLWMQAGVQNRIISELRDGKEQMKALVEVTMEGICVHENGVILEVNPAFEELFQRTSTELVGTRIRDLVLPSEFEKVQSKVSTNDETPYECICLHRDGSAFVSEVRGRNFIYRGRAARVSSVQDITHRKKMEKEIREHMEDIARLSQERERAALAVAEIQSKFLANMSHEIRTPMNAVIGITDLLNNTSDPVLQKRYLRTLKDSGESLLNLINDILDYSKIEADHVELEKISFSLSAAVEAQADLLWTRAHQRNLSLNVFIDPKLPVSLKGDYGRISQVMLNLMGNAIKFTDDGGVSVKVDLVRKEGSTASVRIEVKDTGMGISLEASQKLFKPFSQADSSTARKHGGTGLGLSICKKLVELMGGTIGFSSIIGRGTTFWFEIPFEIDDATPISEAYIRKEWSQLNIVVVKDGLPANDVVAHYFRSWELPVRSMTLEEFRHDGSGLDLVVCAGGKTAKKILSMWDSLASRRQKFKMVTVDSGPADLAQYQGLDPQGLVRTSVPLPVRQSDLFNAALTAVAENRPQPEVAFTLPESSTASTPKSFEQAQILVAEDNSTNQLIILALLRQLGLQGHAVVNGVEAVDAVARAKYDLILMDCQMPELDGFGATMKIRELEKQTGGHTPIVALTANVFKEDRERCFASGMDDFLSKPVRREKLVEVLSKYIKLKETTAA